MSRLLATGVGADAPWFGLGRMITDSWPLGTPVGEAILRAEHMYRRAVGRAHGFAERLAEDGLTQPAH